MVSQTMVEGVTVTTTVAGMYIGLPRAGAIGWKRCCIHSKEREAEMGGIRLPESSSMGMGTSSEPHRRAAALTTAPSLSFLLKATAVIRKRSFTVLMAGRRVAL